ncbi:MAG TPA: TetR/AcrR family transcriptional regulator [Flavobacterium sp.]|jgi:AcrR family transcriptional regulator
MKEEILRKATEMFLTLGFKSVTMDDIAAEMGISKKTIYQHFENKPELVEASSLFLFDKIAGGIDNICSLNKNAIEELFEIKNFMMKQLNNESASPLFQLQKYFPNVFSCLRKKQFDKMQDCVKENIDKGISLGLYRKDLDIAFIGRIYFVGLTGIKDTDIFPVSLYSSKDVTEKYLEYHLRAIVTPPGLELLEKLIINKPNITSIQ